MGQVEGLLEMGERQVLMAALEWHLAEGAEVALWDVPVDRFAVPAVAVREDAPPPVTLSAASTPAPSRFAPVAEASAPLGSSEARAEAIRLASAATTLEELRAALAEFEGLDIRRTAMNLVFSDGHPQAPVMIVGEAPGADEDRLGRPFVGVSGQLLDRFLSGIGLSREADDPARSVYISNILNWRPPGNRTPTPAEVEVSLPFIEKHILLARPKLLILAGGVSASALLRTSSGISKLRGRWHDFTPSTPGLTLPDGLPIPTLPTYHPSYLLRTPSQKRAAWADMILLALRLREAI